MIAAKIFVSKKIHVSKELGVCRKWGDFYAMIAAVMHRLTYRKHHHLSLAFTNDSK